MAHDINEWLNGLGLGQYAALFAESAVDFDVLPDLRERDLKELGIPLGHRKRLLKAIELRCEVPGAEAEPVARFEESPRAEGGRRQLTILFCDLVASTELSAQLDPEDLRDIMLAYQRECAAVIARYEGYIAKYMGDGILAYFGFPRAHEDEAERAVRTGLAIIQAVSDLSVSRLRLSGSKLAVRIGINTGPVVVGDIIGAGAAEEASVIGETPNVAARLQAIAQPGHLVVGPLTRQLIGDAFVLEDLGQKTLKGVLQPINAWRVVSVGKNTTRHAGRTNKSRAPLVGRQEEFGLLLRSWEASRSGHGQVVLLQGEAGIGKSRLVDALRSAVSGRNCLRIALQCSPFHSGSTLHPVVEHLKRAMGWARDDGPAQRLTRLERALSAQSLPMMEAVPLFADLLGVPIANGSYPHLELGAQEQRQQTLDALVGWLLAEAETRPVLCVWEDLHWADPTTMELVRLCVEQSQTVAMMTLLTFRPDFALPWPMRSHMVPITLSRLERREIEPIIARETRGKPLPDAAVNYIVDKSDGVPLYVEELTKALLESDFLDESPDRYQLTHPISDVGIPVTLQDMLMARLDRLPTMRAVAQLGAILGREFTYEMLHAIAAREQPELQSGLDRLVDAELLYRRGRPPQARYVFKHALVQDAAYHSLLKRTRKYYHQQVAELLESRNQDSTSIQPELIAYHYAKAECNEKAVKYFRQAGDKAAEIFAHTEAAMMFEQGLIHAHKLPIAQRDKRVLELTLRRAESLHFLGRRQELVDMLECERKRLERAGDPSVAGNYHFWLGFAHSFLGHRADADRELRLGLEQARQSGDQAIAGRVHRALAMECVFSGLPLSEALRHGREAVELLELAGDRFWLGQAFFALGYSGYWRGDFNLALNAAARLDALGVRTGSRRERANATMITGMTHATRGDWRQGIETLQVALSLAPDAFETAWVLAALGKAHLEAGDEASAIGNLTEAIELADRLRSVQLRSWFRTILANAYILDGRTKEAADITGEALVASVDVGYLFGVGQAHQALGRLAQSMGRLAEARLNLDLAVEELSAVEARFELARTHLDLAAVAAAQAELETAEVEIKRARSLFIELDVPKFVEQTEREAQRLGILAAG